MEKYTFKKVNIFILLAAIFLWCGWSIYFASLPYWIVAIGIGVFCLGHNIFIEEVAIKDNKVVIKNCFKFKYTFPMKKILSFGIKRRYHSFYILCLTSFYLPMYFEGRPVNVEDVLELSNELKAITSK